MKNFVNKNPPQKSDRKDRYNFKKILKSKESNKERKHLFFFYLFYYKYTYKLT